MLDRHALALALPAYTLLWGVTAPHTWSALWLVPVGLTIALDVVARPDRGAPLPPSRTHDVLMLVLAAAHIANLGFLAARANSLTPFEWGVGVFLVGSASGYSAIVVAHELVHRTSTAERWLGRVLLTSVFYDHFHIEHVRGHHKRVATADDPATARHGEPFGPFLLRSVVGQLASAIELEARRGRTGLRNGVLHGFVAAAFAAAVLGAVGGGSALAAHLVQAAWAITLLEAVNYIEHWGLSRAASRVSVRDSFDSEGWFTRYTLIGLARHADHHANAARPYPALRWVEESPKMPWGYWATALGAVFVNGVVRRRLDAELRRCGLGPYATQGTAS